MNGRYREVMTKLVSVEYVDLRKIKIKNLSIIAMTGNT